MGSGDTGVAQFGWDERQTCSCRHFKGGRASITQQAKESCYRLAKGAGNCLLYNLASRGINQRLYRSLTAVCNWHYFYFCLWVGCSYSLCDGLPGLGSRETAFERLGGNENAHGYISVTKSVVSIAGIIAELCNCLQSFQDGTFSDFLLREDSAQLWRICAVFFYFSFTSEVENVFGVSHIHYTG